MHYYTPNYVLYLVTNVAVLWNKHVLTIDKNSFRHLILLS